MDGLWGEEIMLHGLDPRWESSWNDAIDDYWDVLHDEIAWMVVCNCDEIVAYTATDVN